MNYHRENGDLSCETTLTNYFISISQAAVSSFLRKDKNGDENTSLDGICSNWYFCFENVSAAWRHFLTSKSMNIFSFLTFQMARSNFVARCLNVNCLWKFQCVGEAVSFINMLKRTTYAVYVVLGYLSFVYKAGKTCNWNLIIDMH